MDSKIKILVGVLVVGVILIGGWWIWSNFIQEKPTISSQPQVITETSISNITENPERFNGTNVKVEGRMYVGHLAFDPGGIIMEVFLRDSKSSIALSIKDVAGYWSEKSDKFKAKYDGKNVIVWGVIQWSGGNYLPSITITNIKLTEEITITTDKTEYQQGEKITATLNYKDEIYAWGEYAWLIQRWENDTWTAIQRKGDKYFFCANIPECKDVSLEEIKECPPAVLCEREAWYMVGDTPKLVWDQFYMIEEKTFLCKYFEQKIEKIPCAVFEQAPPGKYKIRFEYTAAINPDDPFSREVDIQYAEKEIVIK